MGAFMTTVVRVSIEDDHKLVCDFLEWQLKTKTFSVAGTGSSGGGQFVADFNLEDEAAIEEFFDARL